MYIAILVETSATDSSQNHVIYLFERWGGEEVGIGGSV